VTNRLLAQEAALADLVLERREALLVRVIRDASQANNLTNDRYNYVIGEQKRSAPEEKLFWPDSSAPVLPPLPQTPATPLPAATSTPPK